jgi:hypothetical protein
MARNRSVKKKLSKRKKKLKKFKGVRYIAQKLQKYYNKRYTSFAPALIRARIILEKLNEQGLPVSVRNIFSIERVPRVKKEEAPIVPDDMLDPQEFFLLADTNNDITNKLPNNLLIKSKISKKDLPMLRGGVDNSVELGIQEIEDEYFKDFINYGNELQKTLKNPYPIFFRFTVPSDKIEKGKWISYIILCDESGLKGDIGFDPDNITPTDDLFISNIDYSTLSYNDLRKEISTRKNITVPKNPKKAEMISLLEKDDLEKAKSQEKTQPIESKKPSSSSTDKETIIEERKKIEALNESKRIENDFIIKKEAQAIEKAKIELRQKELDMESIQWGIMTPAEFKKKWNKK